MAEPVLFIAHHFPPMGGPGVYRSLNFVKNLPSLGYKPYVLTITEKDVYKSRYPVDESMMAQVPKDTPVFRVSPKEPKKMKTFLLKVRLYRFIWTMFYPLLWETSAFWPFLAYPTAKRIIRENNIKLIYTTSGPFSALLLGYMLKKRLNVKWVADMRDPFTESFGWRWPTKMHWKLSRRMEKMVLGKVDKLIVVTPEMGKMYAERNIIKAENIITITNGF